MLLGLLLACADPASPHAARPVAPAAARVEGNGYSLDDAEMADRWVLERDLGETCDGVTLRGWTVSPLFSGTGLPDGLARYCLFERRTRRAADPATLGAVPDLAVVAGMATGADPEALADSYAAQLRPTPAFSTPPEPLARLTLVDTTATHEAGSPEVYEDGASVNPHGQAMATLALRGICDDDASESPVCAASLASQLGLGFTYSAGAFVSEPTGGNFGSQADLARAIHAAVLDWDEDHDRGDAGPLVLSLSLGWHPDAGGPGASLDAPVAAVHAALTWASCRDVLVVAAVGNLDTPSTQSNGEGPLYPAAWEVEPAPKAAECAESTTWDVADAATDQIETTYRPLIYGVSALDESQRALANQRPGAQTPHAAPGAHVTAWNTGLGTWIDPVSGTSAATASVAAAAAVVRTHAPDLSAHDVMRVLRDGGTAIAAAETCYDPEADGCDATYAVTVCDALVAACASGYATCDSGYTSALCDTLPDPGPQPIGDLGDVEDSLGATRAGRCGSGTYLTDTRVRYACPWEQLYGATALPLTLPQPPGTECPWCPAALPNRVDLFTSSDLSTLRNVTISVTKTTAFGTRTTVHYPLGPLVGTSRTVYLPDLVPTDLVTPLDTNVSAVVLSYTVGAGTLTFTEPLALTWAP